MLYKNCYIRYNQINTVGKRGEQMKVTFLIGNGFDIALSQKYNIYKTRYKDMYNFTQKYFKNFELTDNRLAQSIYEDNSDVYWSDFESGLIKYFKKEVTSEKTIIDYFKDKDQLCNYINDYLMDFYQDNINKQNFINDCLDEFYESVLNFLSRMSNSNRDKLIPFIENKTKLNPIIQIDFINFNGTNTLEKLVNELKKNLYLKVGDKKIKSYLGTINYVHSKIEGKTENYYNYAFGTTEINFFEDIRFNNAINKCEILPTSILNALDKTNYEFIEWINNTDLFITHGLSFGNSDEYYWGKVIEKIYSGSMLVDFPFVNKESKISVDAMNEIKNQRISKIAKYDNKPEVTDKIIISNLSSFKPQQDSSSIFSF